jgi:hypothetical protein
MRFSRCDVTMSCGPPPTGVHARVTTRSPANPPSKPTPLNDSPTSTRVITPMAESATLSPNGPAVFPSSLTV